MRIRLIFEAEFKAVKDLEGKREEIENQLHLLYILHL